MWGLRVFITGYSLNDLEKLKDKLKKCGFFGLTRTLQNADVVVSKNQARNGEILFAILNSIPVVSADWISVSMNKKAKQPFDNYILKNKFMGQNLPGILCQQAQQLIFHRR